jgi:hypothetical protein
MTYTERLEQRVREAHERQYQCKTWEQWSGRERDGLGKTVEVSGIGCREHHVCFAR